MMSQHKGEHCQTEENGEDKGLTKKAEKRHIHINNLLYTAYSFLFTVYVHLFSFNNLLASNKRLPFSLQKVHNYSLNQIEMLNLSLGFENVVKT